MTIEQLTQFYTDNQHHISWVVPALAFLIAWNRWSKWKVKAASCSGTADVIKTLREQIDVWKTSSMAKHSELTAERKARAEELATHLLHWRRMSDRLLRDGKHQPQESGFSDEALRRIGSFAAGEMDAGDWLDEVGDEIGVESESNYTELVESLIKARKG